MSEFRRRLMISKLDFVDNLKSMGCVFYLPLNDNTDISITDQISGNKLILSNNSYFDEDVRMYRFKSVSYRSCRKTQRFAIS